MSSQLASSPSLLQTAFEQLRRSPVGALAVDAIAHVKAPGLQMEIWRDYIRTRESAGFLRQVRPITEGRRALIASFGGIGSAKLEGILAAGLQARGWSVMALGSRAWPWVRRYQRALGVRHHLPRQVLPFGADLLEGCTRDAHKFIEANAGFRETRTWSYCGARIGPPLLSSIQRAQRLGSPDPRDPSIRAQIVRVLPKLLAWVHQAGYLLESAAPDLLYLIESNDWNGPLVDLAIHRGVDVIQLIQPIRDDALIFKRLNQNTRRFHANSISQDVLATYVRRPWTEHEERALEREFSDRYGGRWFLQSRNQPGTRAKTATEIRYQLGLQPGKKIAVIFSHILWDANLFYGEDLFEDYADWLIQTVRAAAANPNLNWILKLHPANIWKRAFDSDTEELAELTVLRQNGLLPLPDHVKLLPPETDVSALSLFQSIDYGVTVRGTAGLELPCFGVPTLTAGTGRYSGLGFTRDFATKEDYLRGLVRLHEAPQMTANELARAKWHALAVFQRRPWVFRSFRSVFNVPPHGKHPLAYNFELVARSWPELEANGDLLRWADWAGNPDRPVDYLAD